MNRSSNQLSLKTIYLTPRYTTQTRSASSSSHSPSTRKASYSPTHLVKPLGRAHARLNSQAAHVLPRLLQQADEVVDGQHDVADQLILGHADVADRDAQAEHLLQLELDGRFHLGDL